MWTNCLTEILGGYLAALLIPTPAWFLLLSWTALRGAARQDPGGCESEDCSGSLYSLNLGTARKISAMGSERGSSLEINMPNLSMSPRMLRKFWAVAQDPLYFQGKKSLKIPRYKKSSLGYLHREQAICLILHN